MKGIAAPLALATLTTAVSAFPHARGSVFDNAVELEVRDYFQPVSHLERRQFGAGPPPPPPASLPYAYGLSSTNLSAILSFLIILTANERLQTPIRPQPLPEAGAGRLLATRQPLLSVK